MAASQGFSATRLAPKEPKSRNSLLNSLITGNSHGDWFNLHCVASQAFWRFPKLPKRLNKALRGNLKEARLIAEIAGMYSGPEAEGAPLIRFKVVPDEMLMQTSIKGR